MKFHVKELAVIFFAGLCSANVSAQFGPPSVIFTPGSPTSADILKLSISARACGGVAPYVGNPYRVSMVQNNIVVLRGPVDTTGVVFPTSCPPNTQFDDFDLGRLPPGTYSLTVTDVNRDGSLGNNIVSNLPVLVADARATKAAPFVRADYSGHWWDPNDGGWGVFIWQDARSVNDPIFIAWFSYDTDGKPKWYVFQPEWQTTTITKSSLLVHGNRLPGTSSPPSTQIGATIVGTASLDFTNYGVVDEAKLTYTFTGGATIARTIKRFKP